MSLLTARMMQELRSLLIVLGADPAKLRRMVLPFNRTFDECAFVYEWFRSEGKKSGVMVDVGVAWGSAVLPFLKDGWTVHGFEPDIAKSKMQRLEALRDFPKFTLHQNAVSSTSGEVLDFYQSSESEGISSLHDFEKHQKSHSVTTVALRDFFKTKELSSVDFLKIDVEGHEKWVLDGLDLDELAPHVIVLEFDDKKTIPLGYSWKVLADRLVGAGYFVFTCEWYPIQKYGSMHRFRDIASYPNELVDKNGWGNLIAVRKEHRSSFKLFIDSKIKREFKRAS